MYNLVGELPMELQLSAAALTREADFLNAEWQKGTVQSVMEDILEALMELSAGHGGTVTQWRGAILFKFSYKRFIFEYLKKIYSNGLWNGWFLEWNSAGDGHV